MLFLLYTFLAFFFFFFLFLSFLFLPVCLCISLSFFSFLPLFCSIDMRMPSHRSVFLGSFFVLLSHRCPGNRVGRTSGVFVRIPHAVTGPRAEHNRTNRTSQPKEPVAGGFNTRRRGFLSRNHPGQWVDLCSKGPPQKRRKRPGAPRVTSDTLRRGQQRICPSSQSVRTCTHLRPTR